MVVNGTVGVVELNEEFPVVIAGKIVAVASGSQMWRRPTKLVGVAND
jgi:hypothetical protein